MINIKITPIFPPKGFPENLITLTSQAIKQSLNGPVKAILKRSMEDRMRGWEKPARISSTYRKRKDTVLHVFPSGKESLKWKWVSQGTRPYSITASRSAKLRIRTYSPHTRAGNRYGLPGGGVYSPTAKYPKTVLHPGIDAREFEEHIVKEKTDAVVAQITGALNLALGGI